MSADPPVSREDLPDSLFPVKSRPLRHYNQQELEELASKPQKTLPVPECEDEGKRRRLANLAQYKGRSKEGQKRALGNLRRKIPDMVKSKDNLPVPTASTSVKVPAKIPTVPAHKTARGKWLRAVLTKEEWDLYVEEWNRWLAQHTEDYTHPEDLDDVHTICQETVNMYRMELLRMEQPKNYDKDAYNQSFRRKQQARENLMARRSDREGGKKGGGATNVQIAVLAGQVQQPIEVVEKKAVENRQKELDFLENTTDNVHNLDIIETQLAESEPLDDEED